MGGHGDEAQSSYKGRGAARARQGAFTSHRKRRLKATLKARYTKNQSAAELRGGHT